MLVLISALNSVLSLDSKHSYAHVKAGIYIIHTDKIHHTTQICKSLHQKVHGISRQTGKEPVVYLLEGNGGS